jgi:hypothetical protein
MGHLCGVTVTVARMKIASAPPTRSGRLPRLRRAAHRPTGGERAAPPVLSRYAPSPDRPPPGTASPNASGIGSPFRFGNGRGFLKKSFSSGRAAAKNSEEWRAIRLRIVRRYRNRPEGGMPATEYYAMACTVESDPCPARRRRGKRALLTGVCAVPSS